MWDKPDFTVYSVQWAIIIYVTNSVYLYKVLKEGSHTYLRHMKIAFSREGFEKQNYFILYYNRTCWSFSLNYNFSLLLRTSHSYPMKNGCTYPILLPFNFPHIPPTCLDPNLMALLLYFCQAVMCNGYHPYVDGSGVISLDHRKHAQQRDNYSFPRRCQPPIEPQ